jgi:hypothetical protein
VFVENSHYCGGLHFRGAMLNWIIALPKQDNKDDLLKKNFM